MLFSNPRVLPAFLFCIGLAIVIMRGQELKSLEAWNPEDLETAVELNYALDMARSGQVEQVSETEKAKRKQLLRTEIENTFILPRQKMQTEYKQGMWMAAAGAILMALVLVLQQRGILKK